MRGWRYKRWYETPLAAECRNCGKTWKSMFEVFRLDACPACGHREKQSKAYQAAHPEDSPP